MKRGNCRCSRPGIAAPCCSSGGRIALRSPSPSSIPAWCCAGKEKGEDGTILFATGTTKRTFLTIGPTLKTSFEELPDSRRIITDSYVPWSAQTLTVEKADDLKPGDLVAVYRPATAAWIHDLGMDNIPAGPDRQGSTKPWRASGYHFTIERKIVSVEGDRVTLDAPPMIALDQKYAKKRTVQNQVQQNNRSGVENIRFVSEFRGAPDQDEEHAWIAVYFAAVEHAWARNLALVHFASGIVASRNSKYITVTDCDYRDPVSLITGGRRHRVRAGRTVWAGEKCDNAGRAPCVCHGFPRSGAECVPRLHGRKGAGRRFRAAPPVRHRDALRQCEGYATERPESDRPWQRPGLGRSPAGILELHGGNHDRAAASHGAELRHRVCDEIYPRPMVAQRTARPDRILRAKTSNPKASTEPSSRNGFLPNHDVEPVKR